MKKIITSLFALLFIVSALFGTGCNTHIHEYQYFVINEPTCTQEGKLEGICSCGEKIVQTVSASHKRNELGVCSICGDVADTPNHKHNWSWSSIVEPTCTTGGLSIGSCSCGATTSRTESALEHNRVNGICTECGDGASVIPEGQSIGYTIEDVLDKVEELGFRPVNLGMPPYFRMEELYGWSISEVKIDKLNLLHIKVGESESNKETIIPLGNQRVDFNILTPTNVQFVLRIDITGNTNANKLCVVSADGTSNDYGYIEGISSEVTDETKVKSIFINQNNLLLIAYTDNTVKVAGKIATVNEEIGGGQLIYEKQTGMDEYKVIGLSDKHLTKIVIPDTHRGLPVTEISKDAFYKNSNITEVVFGANIKTVEFRAFYECEKLKNVVLNDGLKIINNHAFAFSPIDNIVIPFSVSVIGYYAFDNYNDIRQNIYLNDSKKPYGWTKNRFGNSKVYLLGEWEYVNGVPTPKQ